MEHGEINILYETGFTLHFRGEDIEYLPNAYTDDRMVNTVDETKRQKVWYNNDIIFPYQMKVQKHFEN